jgi:hypothetical protein
MDSEISMRLGCGRDKVRPRFTRRRRRWRVTISLMTLADRLAMERFWLVECERSKYSFEFVDATQTWLVRWDPNTPPSFASDSRTHGRHHFEGTMIEVTAGPYGPGDYGGQYYAGGD